MECKYYFGDLVYVDFDDHKIIGTVQAHRIIKNKYILYNISDVDMFVPESMIHILTIEENEKYNDFLQKEDFHCKEEYIKAMQQIFTIKS